MQRNICRAIFLSSTTTKSNSTHAPSIAACRCFHRDKHLLPRQQVIEINIHRQPCPSSQKSSPADRRSATPYPVSFGSSQSSPPSQLMAWPDTSPANQRPSAKPHPPGCPATSSSSSTNPWACHSSQATRTPTAAWCGGQCVCMLATLVSRAGPGPCAGHRRHTHMVGSTRQPHTRTTNLEAMPGGVDQGARRLTWYVQDTPRHRSKRFPTPTTMH